MCLKKVRSGRTKRLSSEKSASLQFDFQGRRRQNYNQRRRALRTIAAAVCTMKKRIELSLTQKAMQALTNAVAKVVEDHRRRAKPLAVWRDGKAVWISRHGSRSVARNPYTLPTQQAE